MCVQSLGYRHECVTGDLGIVEVLLVRLSKQLLWFYLKTCCEEFHGLHSVST